MAGESGLRAPAQEQQQRAFKEVNTCRFTLRGIHTHPHPYVLMFKEDVSPQGSPEVSELAITARRLPEETPAGLEDEEVETRRATEETEALEEVRTETFHFVMTLLKNYSV